MSSTTWNGSSSTDWATGANWSTGSVPTTGAHIVIPDTSSINNCVLDTSRTIGSLTIQTNGTLVGGGNKLIIQSEGDASGGTEHFAVKNDGIVSGNLDLEFTFAGETAADFTGSSGNFQNVKLNASGADVNQVGAATFDGTLIIVANATYDAGNDGLTVAGALTNNGTLTLNGSTVNLGSTSTEAGDVTGSGTFNLDTSTINYHTAGGANFIPSTSANFDTNTSTLNLIGLNGSNRAHNFTFASGNMHNITTSRGAGTDTHTDTLNGNCTITGDLTVGANSNFSTGSRVFTVNGDVDVTGQLISNGSDKPMTFGSLTINSGGTYLATSGTTTIKGNASSSSNLALNIDSNATFTHNSGTILFDGTNTFGGSSYGHFYFGDKTFNNITINASGKFIQPRKSSTTTLDINGDLTITAGQLSNYNNDIIWDIAGDVDVSGTLGITDSTGAYSFGSLTINSGGTYNATSGTTTITDETSGGYGLINSGTYTHNKGKLKIDFNTPNKDAHTIIQVNDLYDLEIDMNASNYEVKFDDTSGNATNILNNLDITQGVFESKDNGDTLTIHGLTRITSNGTFMPDANHDTNKIIHNGLVTNSGTYKINDGTTVKMNGGIRNLGTITVA